MDTVLVILTMLSLAAAGAFALTAWRARADAQRRSAARVAALASTLHADDLADSDALRPVHVASMFATAAGAAGQGGSFSKQAIITAVATALLIGGGMMLRDDAEPPAVQRPTAPLELISMRHTRDGRTLTVTGLVRNPAHGAPLTRVAALVFAFDRSGGFVASGRAALDFTTLQPGDESPFVVTLSDLAEVGRYRVSFRTEDGLLRHVDRRVASQLVRVP